MDALYRIQTGLGFDRDGQPILDVEAQVCIDKVKRLAGRIFGGCTVIRAEGSYCNSKGEVVSEPSAIIELLVLEHFDTERNVKTFADMVKAMFRQESVLCYRMPVNQHAAMMFV